LVRRVHGQYAHGAHQPLSVASDAANDLPGEIGEQGWSPEAADR
jgi:hypothetical protein